MFPGWGMGWGEYCPWLNLKTEQVWGLGVGGRPRHYRVNPDPIMGTSGSSSAGPTLVRTFGGKDGSQFWLRSPKGNV